MLNKYDIAKLRFMDVPSSDVVNAALCADVLRRANQCHAQWCSPASMHLTQLHSTTPLATRCVDTYEIERLLRILSPRRIATASLTCSYITYDSPLILPRNENSQPSASSIDPRIIIVGARDEIIFSLISNIYEAFSQRNRSFCGSSPIPTLPRHKDFIGYVANY